MRTNANITRTGIAIHWLMALAILGMLGLGLYMVQGEHFHLYHLHKSIGVLLLLAILGRLWYRLRQGWPTPAGNYPRHERLLAKASHWCLLAGILLLPLTGMLYSGAKGYGISLFSLPLFPKNLGPEGIEPFHSGLAAISNQAHRFVGYALLGIIALHALGALKHHFIDRDDTLRRMLGRAKVVRREDPRSFNAEKLEPGQ